MNRSFSALRAAVVSPWIAAAALCCGPAVVRAQASPEQPAPAAEPAPPAASAPGQVLQPTAEALEPDVRRVVIDADGTRIEELRVRGQTQRITVTPKVGGGRLGYEIVTGDGSRDLSDGAFSTRGAIGKRVWHVLSF